MRSRTAARSSTPTATGRAEVVFYNGYRGGEHIASPDAAGGGGAGALGIENLARAGVQGRGVLLDLQAEYGAQARAASATRR